MSCHFENIFQNAFEIEYTTSDKVRQIIKRFPLVNSIRILLLNSLKKTTNRGASRETRNSRSTKIIANEPKLTVNQTILKLSAGDAVRVRTREEISKTLNAENKFEGVEFMQEMWKYCGQEFKVFKRVEKIHDPWMNRYRKCKSLVILNGLICHGSVRTPECDRSCFFYWKEAWLQKI